MLLFGRGGKAPQSRGSPTRRMGTLLLPPPFLQGRRGSLTNTGLCLRPGRYLRAGGEVSLAGCGRMASGADHSVNTCLCCAGSSLVPLILLSLNLGSSGFFSEDSQVSITKLVSGGHDTSSLFLNLA